MQGSHGRARVNAEINPQVQCAGGLFVDEGMRICKLSVRSRRYANSQRPASWRSAMDLLEMEKERQHPCVDKLS